MSNFGNTEKVKSFHFTHDISKVPTSGKGLQLTGAEDDARVPDALKTGAPALLAT